MDRRKFLATGAGLAAIGLAAPRVARAATLTLRFAHFASDKWNALT